jgi:hypothetical protein
MQQQRSGRRKCAAARDQAGRRKYAAAEIKKEKVCSSGDQAGRSKYAAVEIRKERACSSRDQEGESMQQQRSSRRDHAAAEIGQAGENMHQRRSSIRRDHVAAERKPQRKRSSIEYTEEFAADRRKQPRDSGHFAGKIIIDTMKDMYFIEGYFKRNIFER